MKTPTLLAALLLLAPIAAAQTEDPASPTGGTDDGIGLKLGTTEEGEEDEEKKPRSRRPRIRDGSWLRKNEPLPEVVEVKSRYEAFMEAELRKHYARLAVLDRILEVAEENDEKGLASRVDTVRRKEVQRFRRAMTQFRLQAQARRVAGFE